MNIVPIAQSAAGVSPRAASGLRQLVERLRRPLAKSFVSRGDAPRMPPCVWYGRSMFCFHIPSAPSRRSTGILEHQDARQG